MTDDESTLATSAPATGKPGVRAWHGVLARVAVRFALVGVAAVVVALVVVPRVLGGMSLTVLTGSMQPHIMPGDMVVTRGIDTQQARSLNVGDIITFLPYPDDPTLVTHRIVAKSVGASGTSFITKGDDNNAADAWGPVFDYQVRGQMAYVVPKAGWVRQWAGQHVSWAIPVVGAAMLALGLARMATSWRRGKRAPAADAGGLADAGGAGMKMGDDSHTPARHNARLRLVMAGATLPPDAGGRLPRNACPPYAPGALDAESRPRRVLEEAGG